MRCSCFPLDKTVPELEFSARDAAHWSVMQVCLTHCAVRERFDANYKREAFSRNVNRLRELFYTVNMMFTKSYRLLSRVLSARCLVLISTSRRVRM